MQALKGAEHQQTGRAGENLLLLQRMSISRDHSITGMAQPKAEHQKYSSGILNSCSSFLRRNRAPSMSDLMQPVLGCVIRASKDLYAGSLSF